MIRIFDTLQIIFREGTPSRDPQVLIISPQTFATTDTANKSPRDYARIPAEFVWRRHPSLRNSRAVDSLRVKSVAADLRQRILASSIAQRSELAQLKTEEPALSLRQSELLTSTIPARNTLPGNIIHSEEDGTKAVAVDPVAPQRSTEGHGDLVTITLSVATPNTEITPLGPVSDPSVSSMTGCRSPLSKRTFA